MAAVEGPTREWSDWLGAYWVARVHLSDGVVHDLSAASRKGCQKLIDRVLAGDVPGGV